MTMQDAKIRNLHTIAQLCQALVFSYIGSVSARHSSSGVSQTLWHSAEAIFGCLYLAGRPSRWASAHILLIVIPLLRFQAVDLAIRQLKNFSENQTSGTALRETARGGNDVRSFSAGVFVK